MTPDRRQYSIERYHDGVRAVLIAAGHLTEEELDLRPAPKGRSARETIHYLADSELHESLSLRRMLVDNTPVLLHWDDERYAQRLNYDRPVKLSLELIRTLAEANIELLSLLDDSEWKREGNQQKPWTLTVETWLEEKVRNTHDALMQILNAPSGGRAIPDPH